MLAPPSLTLLKNSNTCLIKYKVKETLRKRNYHSKTLILVCLSIKLKKL